MVHFILPNQALTTSEREGTIMSEQLFNEKLLDERIRQMVNDVLDEREPKTVLAFPSEPMVKIGVAADHLGVTVRHVRQLVASNKIPHYKVGGSVRFKLSEIDQRTFVSLKAAS
jgi:excisionase family DNA binding protein